MKAGRILIISSDIGAEWSEVLRCRAISEQNGANFYAIVRLRSKMERSVALSSDYGAKWSEYIRRRAISERNGAKCCAIVRFQSGMERKFRPSCDSPQKSSSTLGQSFFFYIIHSSKTPLYQLFSSYVSSHFYLQ